MPGPLPFDKGKYCDDVLNGQWVLVTIQARSLSDICLAAGFIDWFLPMETLLQLGKCYGFVAFVTSVTRV